MNAFSSMRTEPQRVRFSLGDVDLMVQRGLLADNARIELIDGDLIQMPSEGGAHIRHKVELTRWLVMNLPDAYRLAPDATLRLSEFDAPDPDLYVYLSAMDEAEVRGPDVLLVVELSETTLGYDLRRKSDLYARFDVREYWVLDLPARRVHVHRRPGVGGYADVQALTYADVLTPEALPGLALRLDDLERLRR